METPASALMRRTETPSWPYFFQTAKSRFDESFAAYRGSCAAKFLHMPLLFLSVIPFILIVPNPHPSDSFAKNF
jgi:hypothetical protein